MKIKLSKSQWEGIGKQAGWNDVEQTNGTDESEETVSSILYEVKSGRMDIPEAVKKILNMIKLISNGADEYDY